MRVLVAGATGVIGSRLVPLPTAVGHEAIGPARARERAAGAGIVVADAGRQAGVPESLEE